MYNKIKNNMKNKKKFLQVINKGGLKWFQFNIYLTCKFIFIFFNVILIYVGIKKIFIFHPIPRSSFGLILVNIFLICRACTNHQSSANVQRGLRFHGQQHTLFSFSSILWNSFIRRTDPSAPINEWKFF